MVSFKAAAKTRSRARGFRWKRAGYSRRVTEIQAGPVFVEQEQTSRFNG